MSLLVRSKTVSQMPAGASPASESKKGKDKLMISVEQRKNFKKHRSVMDIFQSRLVEKRIVESTMEGNCLAGYLNYMG